VRNLLVLKILVAPFLIALATLVSRRWGPAAGGWIAGLPLTSGPVSLLFAIEHGHDYARRAAEATLVGLCPVVIFAAVYARIAAVRSPLVSLCCSLAVYFITTAVFGLIPVALPLGMIALAVVIGMSMALAGHSRPVRAAVVTPAWDVPSRMIAAAVMVLGLTFLGRVVSPHLAGLISPFPVFASIMGVFTHVVAGAEAAHRLLRGIIVGSIAFGAFFVAVVLGVDRLPLVLCYGIASLAALTINAAVLPFLRVQD